MCVGLKLDFVFSFSVGFSPEFEARCPMSSKLTARECLQCMLQGKRLIPFDVAMTKRYHTCAKLIEPDGTKSDNVAANKLETTEEETSPKKQAAGSEAKEENSKDDGQQTEDRDNEKSALEDDSSRVNAVDRTTSDACGDVKHQGDGENDGVKDSAGNSDAIEDDNVKTEGSEENLEETNADSDSAHCKESSTDEAETVAEAHAEPSSDDKLADENQQNERSASKTEGDAKDSKKEDSATEKKQKRKDDVVDEEGDSGEPSKQEMKSTEQRRGRRRKPADAQNEDQNSAGQKSSPRSRPRDDRPAGNSTAAKSGRESPPPAAPNSIQEQVRIFDMRRLTMRQLEKTRRYQRQLGCAGGAVSGSTDKQLTRLLVEDYNEKAHRGYRVDGDEMPDLDALKTHLQGNAGDDYNYRLDCDSNVIRLQFDRAAIIRQPGWCTAA